MAFLTRMEQGLIKGHHGNISEYISRDRQNEVLGFEDDAFPAELRECSVDDQDTYAECQAEKWLILIVCPILMIVSLAGNLTTIAVMSRPKLRTTATAIFIIALSIADITANLTGLTRHFAIKAWRVDVRQLNSVSCVIHRFILYFSMDLSAWLLGVITIERFVAVCLPMQHRKIKSVTPALKILSVVILLQIGFNIQVFFTRGKNWRQYIHPETNENITLECGYRFAEARKYWAYYQGWTSMLWFCLIPFSVMLILNIFIIRKLRTLKDDAMSRAGTTGSSVSATGVTRQANSMTRMLLSVTWYFIVVTIPIFIFTAFQSRIFFDGNTNDEQIAKFELADAMLTMMHYLNHSINFFFYCLTGRRFRRELNIMCGCMRKFNRKLTKTLTKRSAKLSSPSHKLPNGVEEEGEGLAGDYNQLSSADLLRPVDLRKSHLASTCETGTTSVTQNMSGL